MKTKVYKGLLNWSRENLQNSNNTSESNSFQDIENELVSSSPQDEYAAKENKLIYEHEENRDLSEVMDHSSSQNSKRMILPKLTFDDVIEIPLAKSGKIKVTKPPIAKKNPIQRVHKSSENPLKTMSKEGEGRISTKESLNSIEKHHTPNFRNRGVEMLDDYSPFERSLNRKGGRNSLLSTTNDKESIENIPKRKDNRVGNRFSDLMNSYDSEEQKEISISSTSYQNERMAIMYCENRLIQKAWKSILIS